MWMLLLPTPYSRIICRKINHIPYIISKIFGIDINSAHLFCDEVYAKKVKKLEKDETLTEIESKEINRIYRREYAKRRYKYMNDCFKMVKKYGYGRILGYCENEEK